MNKNSSNNQYFIWPFRGFVYFLCRPKLWLLPIFSTLILTILLLAIFLIVSFFAWPVEDGHFWWKLWEIFKAFGYATVAVLVGFIVLMPLIITVALDRMIRKILAYERAPIGETGFVKSMYSSTVIFFKTLFWRVFWPIVGLLCAIFLGPLGVFIGQVGIGHLAVIDGVDLTLAIQGKDTQTRYNLYKKRRLDIFCMGFTSAILSMCLSVTILGWILWVPAVFAGVALWVKDWSTIDHS